VPVRIGVRLGNLINERPDEALADWIDWSSAAGLDVVDLPRLTSETVAAMAGSGLAVGTFDVADVRQLLSADEGRRGTAAESVRRQIREAASLGGRLCFLCLVPEDATQSLQDSFHFFRQVFPAICAEAEASGVKLVLEGWPGPAPHYPTLGCTPETLRAMCEAVPSSALCINYDPSHLVRLGIDYLRFLREFGARVAHVHGKDCAVLPEDVYLFGRHQQPAFETPLAFSGGGWRYTIPGEGEVIWAAVAAELDRHGFAGACTVELEDYRYWSTLEARKTGILKAAAHLRQYFG
jgi:sugar phosphate isomerase/epimerase